LDRKLPRHIRAKDTSLIVQITGLNKTRDSPETNRVVAIGNSEVLLAADRAESALYKQRFDVHTGLGNARGFLFPGALVIL